MVSWRRTALRQTTAALVIWLPVVASVMAWGGEADPSSKPFSSQQIRFFEDQVRPILKARCLKCHGEGRRSKGVCGSTAARPSCAEASSGRRFH